MVGSTAVATRGARGAWWMMVGAGIVAIAGCAAAPAVAPTFRETALARPLAPITTLPTYVLAGVSVLQISGTTVPDAALSLVDDSDGKVVATGQANSSGAFVLKLANILMGSDQYSLNVKAAGYTDATAGISVTRNLSAAAAAASSAAALRAAAAASSAAAAQSAADAASAAAAARAAIAGYEASAKSIPYNQLEKDPTALAGTVVTYTAQIFQYDTATTTSNFIASVTNLGYGVYSNNIWADVDPAITGHVCADTIVRFWGSVVGPYTYTTTQNGSLTIPEITIRYIRVLSGGC